MIKIFSNTILSYLENDVNTFIANTKCQIVSIHYNILMVDDELSHNILLHYTMPTE